MRPKLASFKERLAAAQSVKVQTAILGIELDSTLESAHSRLDSLGQPSDRPLNGTDEAGERNEGERKISWQLDKTDYASVFVKADEKNRITYMAGYLRSGKEMPFDKIGQVEKAPVLSDRVVAWDVVRPNRPLIRVVARGSERKANSITMFIVKRPRTD
ncbi:MAG: hypothetical protein ACJ8LL_11315 [Candidatus Udaeobacter sp.]